VAEINAAVLPEVANSTGADSTVKERSSAMEAASNAKVALTMLNRKRKGCCVVGRRRVVVEGRGRNRSGDERE